MTKTTPVFIAQTFGKGKTREDFKRERLHLSAVAGNEYGAVLLLPFEAIDEKEAHRGQRLESLGTNIMVMAGAEVAVFSRDWQESEMCRHLHDIAVDYGMEVIESYSDWRDDD